MPRNFEIRHFWKDYENLEIYKVTIVECNRKKVMNNIRFNGVNSETPLKLPQLFLAPLLDTLFKTTTNDYLKINFSPDLCGKKVANK
jgi:hypothetical protein